MLLQRDHQLLGNRNGRAVPGEHVVSAAHKARETIEILKRVFPGHLILRLGDVVWPAGSPDLTAPDFCGII